MRLCLCTGEITTSDVPEAAWNFYLDGYNPAQKWLKDRVGKQLTFDDIRHYQRMIVALTETGRVMEVVDGLGVLYRHVIRSFR